MDFEELKKRGDGCSNLGEALQLELTYPNDKGTPTEVQDYFRKLKVDFVIAAFIECGLDDSMLKFYNYSMQGYCQVMFDRSYETRIKNNLDNLSSLLNAPVDIRNRREETVVNIGESL